MIQDLDPSAEPPVSHAADRNLSERVRRSRESHIQAR